MAGVRRRYVLRDLGGSPRFTSAPRSTLRCATGVWNNQRPRVPSERVSPRFGSGSTARMVTSRRFPARARLMKRVLPHGRAATDRGVNPRTVPAGREIRDRRRRIENFTFACTPARGFWYHFKSRAARDIDEGRCVHHHKRSGRASCLTSTSDTHRVAGVHRFPPGAHAHLPDGTLQPGVPGDVLGSGA